MQKISFSDFTEKAKGMARSRGLREALLGALVILLVSVVYFSTSFGETLQQSDMMQGAANGQEAKAYYEQTGEKTNWTNSLFSGMPTFQISPAYGSTKFISAVQTIYGLGLPAPANLLFMMMIGFYILMLALGMRWHLSVLGALAYGFSSYFFIIIGAGHIWKFCVLAYVPPTIAGIVLCYKGKLLPGGALTALFAMMQIVSNHVQMTYYFLFVVAILMIAYLVEAIRRHEAKRWATATATLVVAAIVAVGANLTSLYNTYNYSKETVRGRSSELTPKTAASGAGHNVNANGIDRDAVTAWSYGIDETLTLLIPNYKGGATVKPNDYNNEGGLAVASVADLPKANELIESAVITGDEQQDAYLREQLKDMVGQFRQYFGDQPMTNGPVYVGALIVALFLLGALTVKGPLKWALVAATVLSILLSWGHNFAALNYWMIDHFPMYDKFRAPASVLVVAEFAMPMLAVLAVNKIITTDNFFGRYRNEIYVAFGLPILVCLIGMAAPLFGGGLSATEQGMLNEVMESPASMERSFYLAAFDTVKEARLSMVTADSLRSLIILAVGVGLLWLYFKGYLKSGALVWAVAAVVLIDMYAVDKRYLNADMFVKKTRQEAFTFAPTDADRLMLADSTYHRMMDVTSFGSATPSYFHKSIGGYHAAKLTRYNDLIERGINPAKNALLAQARSGAIDLSQIDMRILNMLNTKYLTFGESYVVPNSGALGNAWFVDTVSYVKGADAEMDALLAADPAREAVADESFRTAIGDATATAPGDTISLTSYKPNELTYRATTAKGGVAVFSEIYFPWGWTATIDGAEAPIARADYTLRALKVPAGTHDIKFRFDPQSIRVTEGVAYPSILIVYLALIAAVVVTIAGFGRKKEEE